MSSHDDASVVVDILSGDEELEPVSRLVRACIQCGTCTGSCPNAFAMDRQPRELWRLAVMGQSREIFSSRTFVLCSSCYMCTLRCPRGLELTEAMARLKQIAARKQAPVTRTGNTFYRQFLESVRRHGRVREMEFMTLYFAAMKNPLLPFRFASVGVRLMGKGKLHLQLPQKGRGALDSIFKKVAELEVTG